MKPMVDRVPIGIQLGGGWLFVGILTSLTGLGFLTGITESTSITRVLNHEWLQVWGGVLLVAGILLCVAISLSKAALEKLALNLMCVALLVYGGWISSAVPIDKTGITLILIIGFVTLAQVRVAVIRKLLKPKDIREVSTDGHS
jgi:hypothetical protein